MCLWWKGEGEKHRSQPHLLTFKQITEKTDETEKLKKKKQADEWGAATQTGILIKRMQKQHNSTSTEEIRIWHLERKNESETFLLDTNP